jgi:hypothetical protein
MIFIRALCIQSCIFSIPYLHIRMYQACVAVIPVYLPRYAVPNLQGRANMEGQNLLKGGPWEQWGFEWDMGCPLS